MDSYIELIKILKCDYLRYSSHYGGGRFGKKLLKF